MRVSKQMVSPGLQDYEQLASQELRVLMAQKNLAQKAVARALAGVGINETAKGLSAKLTAGTFSAAYYLAVREVIKSL
ncbi:DUF6471 domain-containing protein [Alcaligenes aquatilis]|uniref:DUF6471 domain-containing protein n=1 Tax=Alcaligenes aquatilis TaxID=323284 RepID=UPI003D22C5FE